MRDSLLSRSLSIMIVQCWSFWKFCRWKTLLASELYINSNRRCKCCFEMVILLIGSSEKFSKKSPLPQSHFVTTMGPKNKGRYPSSSHLAHAKTNVWAKKIIRQFKIHPDAHKDIFYALPWHGYDNRAEGELFLPVVWFSKEKAFLSQTGNGTGVRHFAAQGPRPWRELRWHTGSEGGECMNILSLNGWWGGEIVAVKWPPFCRGTVTGRAKSILMRT